MQPVHHELRKPFAIAGCITFAWLIFLAWAIWDYPSPDHLAIGWIVFLFAGLDGLSRLSHSPGFAILLAVAETLFVFLVSAFASWSVERIYRVTKVTNRAS